MAASVLVRGAASGCWLRIEPSPPLITKQMRHAAHLLRTNGAALPSCADMLATLTT